LIWDVKCPKVFKVINVLHFWQCIQTCWLSYSGRKYL